MFDYCSGVSGRHKRLLEYFGETYTRDNCAACDICLGEVDVLEDASTTAQKILSCVIRLQERFGGDVQAEFLYCVRSEFQGSAFGRLQLLDAL